MTAGTLVPLLHKGSPGKFNLKGGHFDFYLKDSTQKSDEPSDIVLGYQAVAKEAFRLTRLLSLCMN